MVVQISSAPEDICNHFCATEHMAQVCPDLKSHFACFPAIAANFIANAADCVDLKKTVSILE